MKELTLILTLLILDSRVHGFAVGEECQGPTVRCFNDACAFQSCPSIPTATCRMSSCNCDAVFTNNGVDVTQQCKDGVTTSGIALGEECQGRAVRCWANPCDTESCPAISTATCSRDPCSCAAVFTDNGVDVTQQCKDGLTRSTNSIALGEECQGRSVSCWINPCDTETCPGIPTATCSRSPCSCDAVFTDDGADVTQQCKDGVRQTTGIALGEECQGRSVRCWADPCFSESCPSIPTATCSRDPCSCSAVFTNEGNDVTQQCKQGLTQTNGIALGEECQGRAVRCWVNPCDTETCPGVPSATCSRDPCTCSAVFTNAGNDVTQQCKQGLTQVNGIALGEECQGRAVRCWVNPCDTETCPGVPTATCSRDPCSCSAVFTSNGNDVTQQCKQDVTQINGIALGEECQGQDVRCFINPCDAETCPGIPTATCSRAPCSCSAVFTNNGDDVTQQCKQGLSQVNGVAVGDECQGRTVNCFVDPCQFATCPSVSAATCSRSPCACEAVFTSNGVDVTQQCKSGISSKVAVGDECQGRTVNCFVDPCQFATCPSVSAATCSRSPCACEAVFTSNGVDVTQQCKSGISNTGATSSIALGEECQGREPRCFANPCNFQTCPGVPTATCSRSRCTCSAVFTLNGADVTQQCKQDVTTKSFRTKDLGIPLLRVVGQQSASRPEDCSSRCLFPPCLYSFCAAYPSAFCRNDYCNGCRAEFYMGTTNVTDKCRDQIPTFSRPRVVSSSTGRNQVLSGQQQSQRRVSRYLSPWLSLFNNMFAK